MRARVPLLFAIWVAIIAGLVEGAGLLLFQRINWERWGPTLHVSEQILWISPIFNLLLFPAVVLVLGWLAAGSHKWPAARIAISVLAALTVYDWLMVTARLSRFACLLLALGAGAALGRWLVKHETAALRFVRRTLPKVVVLAVLAAVGIQGSRWLREKQAVASLPTAASQVPNILVIVVDTLRADHLSSYGYFRPTSPNIDALAQQGVLFENAISTSSWTYPSHASLLTGRYEFEHGLDRVGPMPPSGSDASTLGGLPTLGEALWRRGYRTAAFSANRTFFTRNLGFGRGFIHFEDYFHSPGDMAARTLYGRELMRLYVRWIARGLKKRMLGYGDAFGLRKRAGVINQEVLTWVDRDAGHPFFAFINYLDVHEPYGAPQSYPKPGWEQRTAIDRYDDGVRYVDDYIGRLMRALERRGVAGNTLVIVTSDHGESLGQHGLLHHGVALYRELIQVPLVILYPGHVPAGERVPQPVTNAAIPATIMDLLGDVEAPFPGPGLTALWREPERKENWPDVLSEVAQHNIVSKENFGASRYVATSFDGAMKSLVTPKWHFIMHKELGDQLYDWQDDPGEIRKLIRTPEGQKIAGGLTERLENLLAASDDKNSPSTPIALEGGNFSAPEGAHRTAGPSALVARHYRIRAKAGSRLMVEAVTQASAMAKQVDPVIAIVDGDGHLYQTCRNPGDDHIRLPGIADATPDAFDDICVNDDADPGKDTDARLEILVPGEPKSNVELNIRVSDWDGRGTATNPYRLQVFQQQPGADLAQAAVQ